MASFLRAKGTTPHSASRGHSMIGVSNGEWEQMEATFLKCLREIERTYVHLPKSSRIRVEKWIEKLVSTGDNVTWRKHRNAYARLLLNMVLVKQFSEPFNISPPDGPLPSFPFHLKSVNSNLLGPHESSFWRDLYDRLQQDDVESNQNVNIFNNHSVSNNASAHKIRTDGNMTITREIDNLNLLVKEQNEKIQLLEQQLHEERVRHELQMQRLHFTHRSEINQLLAERSSTADEAFSSNSMNANSSSERWRDRRPGTPAAALSSELATPLLTRSPRATGSSQRRSGQHTRDGVSLLTASRDSSSSASVHGSGFGGRSLGSSAAHRYTQLSLNENADFAAESLMTTTPNEIHKDIHLDPQVPTNTSTTAALQTPNESLPDHAHARIPQIQPSHADVRSALVEHADLDIAEMQTIVSTNADLYPFPRLPLAPRAVDNTTCADDFLAATLRPTEDDDYLSYLDKFQNQLQSLSNRESPDNIDQLSDDSLRMR